MQVQIQALLARGVRGQEEAEEDPQPNTGSNVEVAKPQIFSRKKR